jgi:hypothetical protein
LGKIAEASRLGQSSSMTFKMGGRSLVACFMMFGTFAFKSTPDCHVSGLTLHKKLLELQDLVNHLL